MKKKVMIFAICAVTVMAFCVTMYALPQGAHAEEGSSAKLTAETPHGSAIGNPLAEASDGMPHDFAIRFSSKYIAEEIYDTYTGTIQKDLVENGTATAGFSPREETLKEIYAKVLEYQICSIDREMTNAALADPNGSQFGVSPNWSYEIKITANGKTYLICGDDTACGYTDTDPDAKNFMNFVRFMHQTLHDDPEYQKLPDAVGGYD